MSSPLPADERQQFEAWWDDESTDMAGPPKGTAGWSSEKRHAWLAWQAARAAVPVEISDEQIAEMADRYGTGRAQGDNDFARAILALRAPVEDDRKVMEQALEALTDVTEVVELGDPRWAEHRCFVAAESAIAALRARLGGQPEASVPLLGGER